LGREVVPDVCSTIETSSGWAGPAWRVGVPRAPSRGRKL